MDNNRPLPEPLLPDFDPRSTPETDRMSNRRQSTDEEARLGQLVTGLTALSSTTSTSTAASILEPGPPTGDPSRCECHCNCHAPHPAARAKAKSVAFGRWEL